MSQPTLSKHEVRQRATAQSFERGEVYYRAGAVGVLVRQGETLRAEVEGSQTEPYRVEITLRKGAIISATCTCSYDGEGDCKHIVAVLLTYIRQDDAPVRDPDDLLETMTADQLRQVIRMMRHQKPELEDWLRVALPGIATSSIARERSAPSVSVDTRAFRRQVRRALHQIDYRNHWQSIWAVVSALEEVQSQARTFLHRGDFNNALTLMRILGEEVAPAYGELEEECQLADFLKIWSEELTEAILGADLSADARHSLSQELDAWAAELSDYGLDEVMDAPTTACERGWKASPTGPDFAVDLTAASLNVLAYQGDTGAYLRSCLEQGAHYRFARQLAELGRTDEALAHALKHPLRAGDFTNEYLELAQFLQEQGHSEAAYQVGMRGLSGEGRLSTLAHWVADLAEKLGRLESAVQAWRAAFDSMPSLKAYQNLKRLSGEQWPALRPQLIARAEASSNNAVLIEMAIEDQEVDRAIRIWDEYRYGDYHLLDKLVDAAADSQPDWAAQQALAEAQKLIHQGSKYYPHAVRWLNKVRQIYLQHARPGDWQKCIASIQAEHGRKYSLMGQLKRLL